VALDDGDLAVELSRALEGAGGRTLHALVESRLGPGRVNPRGAHGRGAPSMRHEAEEYRHAIARLASGVTVVTALDQGRRYAMTASALTSVSLDPILLLVCFARGSDTGRAVRASRRFGLCVLAAERGEEVARRCARKLVGDEDQLDGLAVDEGPGGVPLLAEALAAFVCRVERIVEAGEADVVVGQVEAVVEGPHGAEPIVYFAGGYRRLEPL
jgi:flavin reductase (DIM6/NTAB) family NADH-FMN oxidoreductase RutF